MSAHGYRSHRTWAAAGLTLAVGALLGAALSVPGAAADPGRFGQPASVPAVALAPTTVTAGEQRVVVDPATDIPDTAAAITVRGNGFNPDTSLWVAICQNDSGAPENLAVCLGGPIPDSNATTAWGVVTADPQGAPAGPVVVEWNGDGFEMTLQVPGGADQQADCLTNQCSLYIKEAGDNGAAGPVVALQFAPAPANSTSANSTTSTVSESSASQTSASPTPEPTPTEPVPTTVDADRLAAAWLEAGQTQELRFSGFTPGEAVSVTAQSEGGEPIQLPDVGAADDGSVVVNWQVPADIAAGQYTVLATGRQSLRVGVASFAVTAPPPTSTSSPTPSTSAPSSTASAVVVPPSSETVSSATVSSQPVTSSSAVSTPVTSSVDTSSAAPTTSSAAGPAASGTSSGSSNWWLWVVLALVVLVSLVVGAIVLARRHREDADDDRQAREDLLAQAAAEQAQRDTPVPPTTVLPAAGAAGAPLLDEHPDRPILFSHRQAEQYSPPTTMIGDEPTQMIPTPPPGGPGADPGPGTQQFDPFADDTAQRPAVDPGPGTQQFDPFADDPDDQPGR